jgi:hypothetical protein
LLYVSPGCAIFGQKGVVNQTKVIKSGVNLAGNRNKITRQKTNIHGEAEEITQSDNESVCGACLCMNYSRIKVV